MTRHRRRDDYRPPPISSHRSGTTDRLEDIELLIIREYRRTGVMADAEQLAYTYGVVPWFQDWKQTA